MESRLKTQDSRAGAAAGLRPLRFRKFKSVRPSFSVVWRFGGQTAQWPVHGPGPRSTLRTYACTYMHTYIHVYCHRYVIRRSFTSPPRLSRDLPRGDARENIMYAYAHIYVHCCMYTCREIRNYMHAAQKLKRQTKQCQN